MLRAIQFGDPYGQSPATVLRILIIVRNVGNPFSVRRPEGICQEEGRICVVRQLHLSGAVSIRYPKISRLLSSRDVGQLTTIRRPGKIVRMVIGGGRNRADADAAFGYLPGFTADGFHDPKI